MRASRTAICCVALSLGACGGDAAEDSAVELERVDCDWFEGDNCWKDMLSQAAGCLPAGGVMGTFNTARDRCAGEDGSEVVFDAPVPEDYDYDHVWSFQVTVGGASCMTLDSSDDDLALEVGSDAFDISFGSMDVVISCPDAEPVEARALAMFDCDWGHLPGHAVSWSGGMVSFSLLGEPDLEAVVFTCQ